MSNLTAAASIPTTFALVALFQVRENYAFDSEGNLMTGERAYWKCKGSSEYVVKRGLSVDDVVNMGESGGNAAVFNFIAASHAAESMDGPQDNDMFEESLIGWSYDEFSESVLDTILEVVATTSEYDNDYGYILYNSACHNLTETAMKWGLETLRERGLITFDGPHSAVRKTA